jgi:transcriptional regulator with XRE-family HTH domain
VSKISELVGKNIRERRKALGLTQGALGKSAGGLSAQTIFKIESGRPARESNLRLIASVLGCTVSDLYSGGGVETKWAESSPRDLARLYLQAVEEIDHLKIQIERLTQENQDLREEANHPVLRAYKLKDELVQSSIRLQLLGDPVRHFQRLDGLGRLELPPRRPPRKAKPKPKSKA